MSSEDDKINTLKSKVCRSEKFILSEHEFKDTIFSFEEHFAVPIDKATNNVIFIFKHCYALTIIKELNLGCYLSNQDDNNTYKFI